ncbi:DnaJ-domain-containing protein [Thozetella sp. PMI_491]|nr:DnaJ-domain-containing protein [Thozetella sp. PMI_491]
MLVPLSALAIAASLLSTPAVVNAISAAEIPSDTPVSALLVTAQSHLSKGETNDALVFYDAAIARDPTNYLTFFKRATTYLSMGRTTQATDDFNKVLSLKPGFEGAHLQLAKIRARFADWDTAREQYILAKKQPESEELVGLEEARGAAALAEAAHKAGNWEECVNHASTAVLVANRALSLREMRAQCRLERGELGGAISDLQHILQMKPGDITPHIVISSLTFYALGDLENGMTAIRKCLHSDPESKACKKLLKDEKAIDKKLQKATKSLDKGQPMTAVRHLVPTGDDQGLIQDVKDQVQALKGDGMIPQSAGNALVARLVEMACQAYFEASSKKAKEFCEESLQFDENAFYGLLYSSKKQLEAEEFEASINTLKKASEVRPDKQDIVNPLMQKAQVALKRSKTKDYYKILGVAHDADERQIKSAYRKLSKQHHPDKAAKQGISKDEAEKKMAGINEAYEVLSDPELRARFDRGDDPNNHEQQGQNPFAQGAPFMFQQGGGSQFQFKFGSGGFPGGFPFGG